MSGRQAHRPAGTHGRGTKTAPSRPEAKNLGSVLDEIERCQHTKLILEHLAGLMWSEFIETDSGPPRVTIGLDGLGAVAAREDVLGEVHALLFRAVAEAEARQRRLLGSRVHVGVEDVEGDLGKTGIRAVTTACHGAGTRRTRKRGDPMNPAAGAVSPKVHRDG